MDGYELLRALLALLFVLALILVVAWAVRRYGVDKNWQLAAGKKRRLEVLERLSIDPRRQLVLVRRDKREHLLLLGHQEARAIESFDAKDAERGDA